MLNKALAKIIGTKYERELKRLRPIVQEINGHEPAMEALSDADLAARTVEFLASVQNEDGGWVWWVVGGPWFVPAFNGYPNIQYAFAADYFKYLFFNDPDYDIHDFRLDNPETPP